MAKDVLRLDHNHQSRPGKAILPWVKVFTVRDDVALLGILELSDDDLDSIQPTTQSRSDL